MLDAFSLDPLRTHLNHGSFGAVPRPVQERQDAVRRRAEANPQRFFRVELPGLKEQARATAAAFLGVGPGELAMVRNVTESIATVLSALAWQGRLGRGDAVVKGQQGYGAVRLSVEHWCERTGATVVVAAMPADLDAEGIVAAYGAALDVAEDRGDVVRLVVCDQVTSPLGVHLPVSAICAAAHARSAVCFVDGAHAPGHLPVRPPETGADFWTGTWHKWGFAPRGTTALWVAPTERDGLVPLTTGWNHGADFPVPFDHQGTDDDSGWFSLAAAVDFWRDAGGHDIGVAASRLLDEAAPVVQAALGGPVPGVPVGGAPCLRVVALPEGVGTTPEGADALYEALSARGLETQPVAYDGRGWLRLSATVYNEVAQYDRLADVLPHLLATLPGR